MYLWALSYAINIECTKKKRHDLFHKMWRRTKYQSTIINTQIEMMIFDLDYKFANQTKFGGFLCFTRYVLVLFIRRTRFLSFDFSLIHYHCVNAWITYIISSWLSWQEGKALKLLATAARLDIEDFLQKKVFLEVWLAYFNHPHHLHLQELGNDLRKLCR